MTAEISHHARGTDETAGGGRLRNCYISWLALILKCRGRLITLFSQSLILAFLAYPFIHDAFRFSVHGVGFSELIGACCCQQL